MFGTLKGVLLGLSLVGLLMLGGWDASIQSQSLSQPLRVCHEGCHYSSIQIAIDAANPGDTIEVMAGNYKENLIINKSLHLIARGKVFLWPADTGQPNIIVDASKVNIRGFIIIIDPTRVSIRDNVKVGIKVRSGAEVEIQENSIIGTPLHMLGYPQGVVVEQLASASISRNFIWGHMSGIMIAPNSGLVRVYNNQIISNFEGIHVEGLAEISHNLIAKTELNAIAVKSAQEVTIQKNRIVANKSGVYVINEDLKGEIRIQENVIMESSLGGVLVHSGPAKITNNVFFNNANGIFLNEGAETEIGHNTFLYNDEYGVMIARPPCYEPLRWPEVSRVKVSGSANLFSKNHKGDLCPLDFPWPPGFKK